MNGVRDGVKRNDRNTDWRLIDCVTIVENKE